jgi:hypothetical protein
MKVETVATILLLSAAVSAKKKKNKENLFREE